MSGREASIFRLTATIPGHHDVAFVLKAWTYGENRVLYEARRFLVPLLTTKKVKLWKKVQDMLVDLTGTLAYLFEEKAADHVIPSKKSYMLRTKKGEKLEHINVEEVRDEFQITPEAGNLFLLAFFYCGRSRRTLKCLQLAC